MAATAPTVSIAPAINRRQKARKWTLTKPIRSVEVIYPPPPVWPAPSALNYHDGRPFSVGIEFDCECCDLYSVLRDRKWQLRVDSLAGRTLHFWNCEIERWDQVPFRAGAVAWFVAIPVLPLRLGGRGRVSVGLVEDHDED